MITTIHKIRISFRPPDGTNMDDLFEKAMNKIPDYLNLDNWEDMSGNPACYPYIECESDSLEDAYQINKILYRWLDQDMNCKVDV